MSLADNRCVPCKGGAPSLELPMAKKLLEDLEPGWKLTNGGRRLERTYAFEEFKDALAFADRVGAVAEEEGHHPDLHIGWGRCTVEIWTHKIDGLTESDFYLAAKTDRVFAPPAA